MKVSSNLEAIKKYEVIFTASGKPQTKLERKSRKILYIGNRVLDLDYGLKVRGIIVIIAGLSHTDDDPRGR